MKREDIIRMAREAGIHVYPEFEEAFERFAELVRADERARMAEQPAQQEQNRQIDQLIQERDHRDEIIDKLCDAVLGPDRYEWSSQYFFEDAVREVEERMAEQPAQRKPLTDEEILSIARDHYNPNQRPEISFARAIEAKLKEKNNG